MRFARIEMLSLIWTIPFFILIIGYGMKKRKKILRTFASPVTLASISPESNAKRRIMKAVLMIGVLLFVVLALSGPQYGYKWQKIQRKGIDIIIALDCSRSMLAKDIKPDRLARAKREIVDLLTMLQGDRVGLVAFAGTAFMQCPLTLDYEAFHIFLKALSPDFLPVGGSDIGNAVATCIQGFDEKANAQKAIILITDGENTGTDIVKAAEKARDAEIKLFCIGVGKEQGVPLPDKSGGLTKDSSGKIVLTRIDEKTLRQAAVLTGATYVRSVAGDMDLDIIYKQEIRGKMEAATLEGGRKQVWEDRYQWILALAILALAIEIFLSDRKKSATLFIFLLLLTVAVPARAGNMQEGLDAYQNGKYDKALKNFIDAQLEHPEKPGISYNLGNTFYKLKDYDSALDHFRQVLKTKDKILRGKAFYNIGNTQYRIQQFEEAIKSYQKSLESDPADRQAKENIVFVRKVMQQQKQQQNQKQNKQGQKGKGQQKSGGSDKQKDAKHSPSDSSGDKAKNGNKNSRSQPDKEYGNKVDPSKDGTRNSKQKASGAAENNAKPPEKKDGMASGEKPADRSQAEQMLNRLKDQPG
ncbi:MAG: VWA domain-containing protein, partial [Deltaproteobacteria bacterium]|nr:VWA domain-containing protein [Deltaproteobacteria bacterium]